MANDDDTATTGTDLEKKKVPTAITWTTEPDVVIVDFVGVKDDLGALAQALQTQVQRDFAPLFHTSCTVHVVAANELPGTKADLMVFHDAAMSGRSAAAAELRQQIWNALKGAWVIGLFEKPDQPGALGYHDTTPEGLPLSKCFPLLDEQDGSPLSVTVSHELLEMLADPLLAKAVQSPIDGRFWAYEVCDAVESDAYKIGDIQVSNFVTPQYFEPPKAGPVLFDQMGLVKRPYEVRPGGYMQYFDRNGWHQVANQEHARRSYRMSVKGRTEHRHRREPIVPR